MVRDVDRWVPTLDQVLVVKEFFYVFPEELSSLPLVGKIEFGIEALPGTQPIMTRPYRMAFKGAARVEEPIARLIRQELY